ncbi:hypothetical protein E2C01_016161 [Portunus trituberculatus]|uniref:Uncharacterized protein n=1 Tax=Portunus trituberculatus TaxID=210409 RepID=A0A5B7DNC9_PORTR|nr:hypothetical protein [Portunus trituberculatus]
MAFRKGYPIKKLTGTAQTRVGYGHWMSWRAGAAHSFIYTPTPTVSPFMQSLLKQTAPSPRFNNAGGMNINPSPAQCSP